MTALAAFLHGSPALCLFLSIVVGTVIGRFHIKAVGFGSVVGTLIAGIAIGILARPELPDLLRWTFFYLFLFSIGYAVGPQFFDSLKREAVPQIVLAAIVACTGLAAVVGVSALWRFDEGVSVGLLSGGLTQSAALGTGLSAIAELPIAADAKAILMANAPLADAITYGFGDLGLILFLTWLGPRIMRADLKADAKRLEQQLAAGRVEPSAAPYSLRAFRVETEQATSTVEALQARFGDVRLAVHRVERDGELLKTTPSLALRRGDRIVVSGRRGAFIGAEKTIGPELDAPDLLSLPLTTTAIVVTSADVARRTLGELAELPIARGVYLESLHRGAELMPRESYVSLARGDLLRVVGAPDDVERLAEFVGFVERDPAKTDLTYLAAGICAGLLCGVLKINVGGVALGLGTAGSILVVGLFGGWARSRYPVFGSIPDSAQRLLMDIGLIVFIAIVGMHAGPHAVDAYRASGGAFFGRIFLAGIIVTTAPLIVGAIAARYVLGLSPLVTLGSLAGAQTCTPGLNALREASGSNVGSLAYTVPYAINNILLTVWGPVVVAFVHMMRT